MGRTLTNAGEIRYNVGNYHNYAAVSGCRKAF